MKKIDRTLLQSLMVREQKKFVDERPKSKALFERARKSLLAGVPMNWMVKWAGAFPPFVREAQGRSFSMWTGIAMRTFVWAIRGR
jgi:glutamate-1-semialdehyde 2,1-aminomutase